MKKIFSTLVVLLIMFLPIEVFVLLWIFLGPESFWQRFVIIGAGVYFGLGVQIIFWLVGLLWLARVWNPSEKKDPTAFSERISV